MIEQITPNDVPRDSEERRAWACIHLRRLGTPPRVLATRHGVDVASVYRAFYHSSARMEGVIAEALGLMPQQLFPERYTADGIRTRVTKPRAETATNRAYQHG